MFLCRISIILGKSCSVKFNSSLLNLHRSKSFTSSISKKLGNKRYKLIKVINVIDAINIQSSLIEEDVKDYAKTFTFPEDADTAYYKGLGFFDQGPTYIPEAIIGFEQAVELNPKKYEALCGPWIKIFRSRYL